MEKGPTGMEKGMGMVDRFDRVIIQNWCQPGEVLTATSYGYDRNSNRLWARNLHLVDGDQLYGIDALNRIIRVETGQLNDARTGMTYVKSWTSSVLNPFGTPTTYKEGKALAQTTLHQTRGYDALNELMGMITHQGPTWAGTAYDANGNVKAMPRPDNPTRPQGAVYDAWRRQVALNGATAETYGFDGLGRRIQRVVDRWGPNNDHFDFYYSFQDQMILEDFEGQKTSYVFGQRYVDDVVFREQNSDPVRNYALTESMFTIQGITDEAGDVVRLYEVSPWGALVSRPPQPWGSSSSESSSSSSGGSSSSLWVPSSSSVSSSSSESSSSSSEWQPTDPYNWRIGHQGLFTDLETGLVYNRARMLNPRLHQFNQLDPAGYGDGANLYQVARGNPLVYMDPQGELIFIPIVMLVIGALGVGAAYYGVHEMEQGLVAGDVERYASGQAWVYRGTGAVGAASAIGVGALAFVGISSALGATAAGSLTTLGTGGWTALTASTVAGIAGGVVSGAVTGTGSAYASGRDDFIRAGLTEAARQGAYGGVGGLAGGAALWRLGIGWGGLLASGAAGGGAAGAVQGLIEGGVQEVVPSAVEGALMGLVFAAGGRIVLSGRGGYVKSGGPWPRQLGHRPQGFKVRTLPPGTHSIQRHQRTWLQRFAAKVIPGTPPQNAPWWQFRAPGRAGFVQHHRMPRAWGGPQSARSNLRWIRLDRHAVPHPDPVIYSDRPGMLYY